MFYCLNTLTFGWMLLYLFYLYYFLDSPFQPGLDQVTLEKQQLKVGSFFDKLYVNKRIVPRIRIIALLFCVNAILMLIFTIGIVLYYIFHIYLLDEIIFIIHYAYILWQYFYIEHFFSKHMRPYPY
jgi:hypothetical protein